MTLASVPTLVTSPIKTRRAPATPSSAIRKHVGVVEQVRIACSRQYRLATVIGCLLGAIVPFSTFMIAHHELLSEVNLQALSAGEWPGFRFLVSAALVLGGLLFSAKTVYQWGELALSSKVKAVGFTILLEGVMTTSSQEWLSITALVYLCAINAIATGVTLARGTPTARVSP